MTERNIAAEVLDGLSEIREHRAGKRTLRTVRVNARPLPTLTPEAIRDIRDHLDRLGEGTAFGEVTAFGIDAFAARGAPCLAFRKLPQPLRMDVGGRTLRVAAVQAKSPMVVVKDADGVWSYFSPDGEGVWDSDGYDWNALGVGDLVRLMLQSPELYDRMRAVVEHKEG